MEYIPAMALISGLGADYLKNTAIKLFPQVNRKLIYIVILVGFLQISLMLIKLHPNQNVYFNSLIGGLSGAREKNIPSWGNSFGNAYHQGILWLNQNAPYESSLALIQGTALNIFKPTLRGDIRFNNLAWSGINRNGEYLMELTHQSPVKVYHYAWDYVDRALDPVFEAKVDNVAFFKIWKNDLAHTKKQFQKPEVDLDFDAEKKINEKTLLIKLSKETYLSRVTINYKIDNCDKPAGRVALSADGIQFTNEPDPYPNEFVTELNKKDNTIYQYFALVKVLQIKFVDNSSNTCLFNEPEISVKGF